MSIPVAPRVALLALVAALAAACGSSGAETVRVQRSEVPVKPTPTPVPTYVHPLTGEVYRGDQEWRDRPALALKIDNSRAARPQAGLGDADLVYEELAEGGVTRFIAVFQSEGVDPVGPIRSVRSVDSDILAPLDGLFGYAGGVPPVVNAVRSNRSITDVSWDRRPDEYYRRSGRAAPNNLYTSTRVLWDGEEGGPPQPMFTWPDPQTDEPDWSGEPATEVSFAFASNSDPISWTWDATDEVWERSQVGAPHEAEDGSRIDAATVVIQRVSVRPGDIVDVAGERSPVIDVLGGGDAIVLRAGKVVRGEWSRSSYGSPTVFTDGSGEEIRFDRGAVWVELVPTGRSVDVG